MTDKTAQLEKQLQRHEDTCFRQFQKLERQVEEIEAELEKISGGQEENSTKINEVLYEVKNLCKTFKEVNEETQGMRQIWKDLQGTIRIGAAVRKLLVWVVGLPIIGTGIHSIAMYIIHHFKG